MPRICKNLGLSTRNREAGYANRKTYIVTQYPLIITVEDFWQLVYDSGSQTILLLNEIDAKDETCPVFWPNAGSMHHRHLRIDHVSTDVVTGGVLQRKFKLRNTAKSPKSRLLKQFHLQGWRKGDVKPAIRGPPGALPRQG
ncbi:hypothetical protein MRX96_008535 [Rhipicephalus microplus]